MQIKDRIVNFWRQPKKIHLLIILLIPGIFLRIIPFLIQRDFYLSVDPLPDSLEYSLGAINFIHGDGFRIFLLNNWYPLRYPIGNSIMLIPFAWIGPKFLGVYIGNLFYQIACIPLLFFCSYKLFNKKVAFLATFLFTFSPGLIGWSQIIISENTSLFIGLLVLAFSILFLESKNKHFLYLAVLITSLSILIRYSNLFLIFIPIFFLLVSYIKEKRDVKFSLIIISSILFIIGPLLSLYYNLHAFGSIFKNGYDFWVPGSVIFSKEFFLDNLSYYLKTLNGFKDTSTISRVFGPLLVFNTLTPFLFIFSFPALWFSFKKNKQKFLIMFGLFVTFLFNLFFYSFYSLSFQDFRFLVPTTPFLFIIIAYGIIFSAKHLESKIKIKFIAFFTILLPTLIFLFFLSIQYPKYCYFRIKNTNSIINVINNLKIKDGSKPILFVSTEKEVLAYWEYISSNKFNILPISSLGDLDSIKNNPNVFNEKYILKFGINQNLWEEIIKNYRFEAVKESQKRIYKIFLN